MARKSGNSWGLILISILVLGLYLWWGSRGEQSPAEQSSSTSQSSQGTDPQSGLPWISQDRLPDQAHETLRLIDGSGPYPYRQDGGVFGNFEGILPQHKRGYYHEFTVETPGLDHRGALRIVTGSQGEFYWTDDHYESFKRIRR